MKMPSTAPDGGLSTCTFLLSPSLLPLFPFLLLCYINKHSGLFSQFHKTCLSVGLGNFASTGFSSIFRKVSKVTQVKLDSIPRIHFVLLLALDTHGSYCITWFSVASLNMINFREIFTSNSSQILLSPFLYPLYPEVNSHCFSFLSRFLKQTPSVSVLTLPLQIWTSAPGPFINFGSQCCKDVADSFIHFSSPISSRVSFGF